MEGLNKKLLDFFSTNHNPGLIGLVGTNDVLGLAIREAQRRITMDSKPSLWSHCFVLGDLEARQERARGHKNSEPLRVRE